MSKVGRQQIDPALLEKMSSGGGSVHYGEEEPVVSTKGTMWLQTGFGEYDPDITVPEQGEMIVKNAIVSDDEPVETTDLWFDLDPPM